VAPDKKITTPFRAYVCNQAFCVSSVRKKHILFIQPRLEGIGGIEKVIPTLAGGLADHNYLVSAAVFYNKIHTDQNFWHSQAVFCEKTTRHMVHRVIKVWQRLLFLKKTTKKIKPDVIIVSAQGATIITLLAKKLSFVKVPVVVYVHEAFNASNIFYILLMQVFYASSDGFIFVSDGLRQEFSLKINIKNIPSTVSYNATPAVRNQDTDFDFSIYQKPFFINASRIEKIKGSDTLVDSFSSYAKTNRGTLFVLGTGQLLDILKEKVYLNNAADRIIFLGFRDDVLSMIGKSDAYVSCSVMEGFPVAMLETMSIGTPIIFTDAPHGPREMMGVSLRAKLSYPHNTDFGILFSPPLNKQTETLIFKKRFEEALNKVIANGKQSYSKKLINRSNYFSASSQVNSVVTLLKKYE